MLFSHHSRFLSPLWLPRLSVSLHTVTFSLPSGKAPRGVFCPSFLSPQQPLNQGDNRSVVVTTIRGNNVMRHERREGICDKEKRGKNTLNTNTINHSWPLASLTVSFFILLSLCICMSADQMLCRRMSPRDKSQTAAEPNRKEQRRVER